MTRAFAFLLLAATAAAWGKTLLVGPDSPYRSPGEAIANAAAGDTIHLLGGTYQGNITLDRPLVLEGDGKAVLRGDGSGSVITVIAGGCVIRGLTVEHSGGMLADEDSGILVKSSGNRIERNELRDILFGIYLLQSDHNTVTGNVIQGRARLGLGERGSGIHIWNSRHNTITGNTIRQVRDGIYFERAYWSVIRGNRLFDLRYGLHYMWSDDNHFEDNLSYDNVSGAAIMYSRRITFHRNVFVHNRGFSSFGILFQDSVDCLAEENVIADNGVGIFMESLRSSLLRHNLVALNDVAIQAFSSASGNLFQRNNFVENLSPIRIIGRKTGTRWSDQGIGNYWSNYDGYDLDGNGVGDVPFKIQNVFEHLEGNHPRLRLYLFSPASQALAFAEETFPVIEGSQEFDFSPLMKPVPLSVRLPEEEKRRSSPLWLSVPVAMLASSIALMAKGRRR